MDRTIKTQSELNQYMEEVKLRGKSFELKKMSKSYQSKVLNEIKNGIYPKK